MKCNICETDGISGAYAEGNVIFVLCSKCNSLPPEELKLKVKRVRRK